MPGRREFPFVFCFVTTKQEKIGNTKKLQINKCVFGFFRSKSTTNNMRYYGNMVFVLNGSSNGYSTGTMTFSYLFKQSMTVIFEYQLAPMSSNIDIFWLKFA